MNDPTTGCVVCTLRHDRQRLLLMCSDGEIRIDLDGVSSTRTKTVIHAPKSVRVLREDIRQEATHDAV